MTREEALYCIKADSDLHSEICEECPLYGDTGIDHCFEDALNMAIKALEQEPCEDAISREDALMTLTGEWIDLTDELIHRFIRRIRTLPPVTPQPKTGHWEWVPYDSNPNIGNWHCSECRCVVIECGDKKSKGDIPLYKYCPQCGCRIVEPQERSK